MASNETCGQQASNIRHGEANPLAIAFPIQARKVKRVSGRRINNPAIFVPRLELIARNGILEYDCYYVLE